MIGFVFTENSIPLWAISPAFIRTSVKPEEEGTVNFVIWSYVLLWKKEKSTPIRLPGKNAPSKPISYSRLRSGFKFGTGNPPVAEAKSAGGK